MLFPVGGICSFVKSMCEIKNYFNQRYFSLNENQQFEVCTGEREIVGSLIFSLIKIKVISYYLYKKSHLAGCNFHPFGVQKKSESESECDQSRTLSSLFWLTAFVELIPVNRDSVLKTHTHSHTFWQRVATFVLKNISFLAELKPGSFLFVGLSDFL